MNDVQGNSEQNPQPSRAEVLWIVPRPHREKRAEQVPLAQLLPESDIENLIQEATRNSRLAEPPQEMAWSIIAEAGNLAMYTLQARNPSRLEEIEQFRTIGNPVFAQRFFSMVVKVRDGIEGLLESPGDLYRKYAHLSVEHLVRVMHKEVTKLAGDGHALVFGSWKSLRDLYVRHTSEECFFNIAVQCGFFSQRELVAACASRLMNPPGVDQKLAQCTATLEYLCQLRDSPKENYLFGEAMSWALNGREEPARNYLKIIGLPNVIGDKHNGTRDGCDTLSALVEIYGDQKVDLAGSDRPAYKAKNAIEGMARKQFRRPKNVDGSNVLDSLDKPKSSEGGNNGDRRPGICRQYTLRLNLKKVAQKIRGLGGDPDDVRYVMARAQGVLLKDIPTHLGWSPEKARKHQKFYYQICPMLAQYKELAERIQHSAGFFGDASVRTEERYVSDHVRPVTSFRGLDEDAEGERTRPLDEMKCTMAKEIKQLFGPWIPPED